MILVLDYLKKVMKKEILLPIMFVFVGITIVIVTGFLISEFTGFCSIYKPTESYDTAKSNTKCEINEKAKVVTY